jgi:hypothetical protein
MSFTGGMAGGALVFPWMAVQNRLLVVDDTIGAKADAEFNQQTAAVATRAKIARTMVRI